MQLFRCQCGKTQSIGSMCPPRCRGCPHCGSKLSMFKGDKPPPLAHEFTAHVEQWGPEGPVKIPVCRYCKRPAWLIEQEEGAHAVA